MECRLSFPFKNQLNLCHTESIKLEEFQKEKLADQSFQKSTTHFQ